MQYFKTTTIIDGEGEQIATLEDIEMTAEDVIKLLAAQVDVKEVVALPKVKKTYKKRQEKAEQFSVKPGKPYKAKTSSKDVVRAEIYALADKGMKPPEIAEELGYKLANVYYYMKGYKKQGKKSVAMQEAPTKIGERAIDKKEPMLTAAQYTEVKEAHNEGMAPDFMSLTLGFDIEQIRKAIKADNYTQYTAAY